MHLVWIVYNWLTEKILRHTLNSELASLQKHKLDILFHPPFPDVWKILMDFQEQRPQLSCYTHSSSFWTIIKHIFTQGREDGSEPQHGGLSPTSSPFLTAQGSAQSWTVRSSAGCRSIHAVLWGSQHRDAESTGQRLAPAMPASQVNITARRCLWPG